MNLYHKAKMAWGLSMPKQLSKLTIRDDEHVRKALEAVMRDVISDNWTKDAKIAWAILQGREI